MIGLALIESNGMDPPRFNITSSSHKINHVKRLGNPEEFSLPGQLSADPEPMLCQSIYLFFIILYSLNKVGTTLAFRTSDLHLTKGSSKLPSPFTVSPREDKIPSFPKGLRGGREPSFPKRTVPYGSNHRVPLHCDRLRSRISRQDHAGDLESTQRTLRGRTVLSPNS